MPTIKPAQPYDPEATGSNGNAKDMLLCQYEFPVAHYSDGELLLTGDDAGILSKELERARECFRLHTGRNAGSFNFWLKSASEKQVLDFIKDMLRAPEAEWTGFRITVTVDYRGWDVHTLELFAKQHNSETEVASKNPHQQFALSDTPEERLRRLLGKPPHGIVQ